MSLLQAEFSTASSPYREAEDQTYVFLWDFIDDIEGQLCYLYLGITNSVLFIAGTITVTVAEQKRQLVLGDVLSFFTGAFTKPVLGFNKSAHLNFLHGKEILATSSTCDLILRLPTCHDDYAVFKDKMIDSICGHDGFGRV